MRDNQFNALCSQFLDIARNGAEEDAKAFLTAHFSEFPEDIQGEILVWFFEEGTAVALRAETVAGQIRDESGELVSRLERMTRVMEDKKKLLELEEKVK